MLLHPEVLLQGTAGVDGLGHQCGHLWKGTFSKQRRKPVSPECVHGAKHMSLGFPDVTLTAMQGRYDGQHLTEKTAGVQRGK